MKSSRTMLAVSSIIGTGIGKCISRIHPPGANICPTSITRRREALALSATSTGKAPTKVVNQTAGCDTPKDSILTIFPFQLRKMALKLSNSFLQRNWKQNKR